MFLVSEATIFATSTPNSFARSSKSVVVSSIVSCSSAAAKATSSTHPNTTATVIPTRHGCEKYGVSPSLRT